MMKPALRHLAVACAIVSGILFSVEAWHVLLSPGGGTTEEVPKERGYFLYKRSVETLSPLREGRRMLGGAAEAVGRLPEGEVSG